MGSLILQGVPPYAEAWNMKWPGIYAVYAALIAARELAGRIDARTSPGARIAVIGSEPESYFYARRRAATGYLYVYPLMEDQPFALATQEELIAQVEAARPEYLVYVNVEFSWLAKPRSPERIFAWLERTEARDYHVVANPR